MFGVALVRLRDKNLKQVKLKLVSTCLKLSYVGSNILSEILYIFFILRNDNEDVHIFGYVVLISRILQFFISVYFLIITIGPIKYSKQYYNLLDVKNLSENGKVIHIYYIIIILRFFH